MRKWLLLLATSVILLGLYVPCASAQAPVTLNKSDYYITVLQDGRLRVKWELTFTEHESGRDRIRELAPLDSPHTLLESYGTGPDGRFGVSLQPTGVPNVYAAVFTQRTTINAQYTITVRYEVDRSVFDPTTIDGEDYRVIGWASGQWELAIEVLSATFVLPIELPADITKPEQVTDAVVNQAGVKVGDLSTFNRWVYFPTPDETTGKNWLSIYVEQKAVPIRGQIRPPFYLRASVIPTTRETVIPIRPTPGATSVIPGGLTSGDSRTTLALVCCVGLGIGLLVVLIIVWALRRRKPKKSVYEPPEIEIETFETPGVVPDLSAIETAFYIGNSARTVTLIVLALSNRGVVNIVNRNPLQLEVLKSDEPVRSSRLALCDLTARVIKTGLGLLGMETVEQM